MQLARSFVSEAVLEAVSAIDAHLGGVRVIGQNPYLERLTMGNRTLRHAAPVEVFANGVLASRFEGAFAESGNLPRPDMSRINERILHDLSAHLREHGFTVAASENHGDGTLSRIALIDPVYVEAALARQAASTSHDAASLGSALARREALPERGITNVTDPRVLSEVENAVQKFAADAIVKVGDYLRDVVSAGGSPFVKTPNLYQRRYSGIVDRARVKRGSNNMWRVPISAVIPVMGFKALEEHFDTLFQGRAKFESDKLGTYIATVIAKRMQSQPELGGALVALGQGPWIKDEPWALVAVCAPAPAPGIFAFVRKLLGGSPPVRGALPPPEVPALPVTIPPVPLPHEDRRDT